MATITKAWPRPRDHAQIASDPVKAESQMSIYLAGMRTLDARNRSDIRQKKIAFGFCIALLGLNGIQAAENLRNSAKSHLIPYIVQTDEHGRILNTEILKDRSLEEQFTPTKTITAELASWVQDWRAVSTDVYAQKSLADRVFSMVADHSEASATLLNWYRANDPVDRGKSMHVEASVRNILPQSLNSYEVYWEEKETNLTSQTTTVSRWRSVIRLSITPPKNEAEVHRNRFGLFIERLTEPQRETQ
ncbi:MAG: conjugal transfer protein TrbF [Bryobacterales bacterium]|jgi:type IV secretory pathway TrbF-like protein|nr:conjugal transfer protein TrbF [Bryobacterales bacterium]